MLGLNRNAHSTAAMVGATAYGQISSVRYTRAPRITRSAHAARTSDTTAPLTVTSELNTSVVRNESRYSGSANRCVKFARPTNSLDVPNASCICVDCHSATPAGPRKNTAVIASCGAISRYGSRLVPKREQDCIAKIRSGVTEGACRRPARASALDATRPAGGTVRCGQPPDFSKRRSSSSPRDAAESSASFGDFFCAQTCSNSSSTTVRICGMLPRRSPFVYGSGGLFSICLIAVSALGFFA